MEANITMQIKAHDFIQEFMPYAFHDFLAPDSVMYPEQWENAKQCAIIAINVALEAVEGAMLYKQSKREYWLELKPI